MLFLNLGIGWILSLKYGTDSLSIERMKNDMNRNIVLHIAGSSNFHYSQPPLFVFSPPGRLEVEHTDHRIVFYVTRNRSGVRIAWRDQKFFTILRHKGTDMQVPADASDPTGFVRQFTHNRVSDLMVEFEGDSVVLRGRCASFHAKQLAQEAALRFDKAIINKITVGKHIIQPVKDD